MSTDPESRDGFGPYLAGVGPVFSDADSNERPIRYGVIEDLEQALEIHGRNTAAFLVEPIQGEAGYDNVRHLLAIHFPYLGLFFSGSSYPRLVTFSEFGSCARSTTSCSSATKFKLWVFRLVCGTRIDGVFYPGLVQDWKIARYLP